MGKRRGQPVHGWVNLDKPVGVSSAKAVAIVRRIFNAAKAGHGGTLDPLASGILPIALGEATKTTAYAMDGRKSYAFTVAWGTQTTTDDAEGEVVRTSAVRPDPDEIIQILPEFTGTIWQAPPAFSAIKIAGKRAYEIAREAKDAPSDATRKAPQITKPQMPEMAARQITIDSLSLESADKDQATFHVACGKGTYIRSLARDIGTRLGSAGHVSMLRRLSVGPFTENTSISLDFLESLEHSAAAFEHLHPVMSALDDIPAIPISENEAERFRHGQMLSGTGVKAQDRIAVLKPDDIGVALCGRQPVALVKVKDGNLCPVRVFNL